MKLSLHKCAHVIKSWEFVRLCFSKSYWRVDTLVYNWIPVVTNQGQCTEIIMTFSIDRLSYIYVHKNRGLVKVDLGSVYAVILSASPF